MTAKIEPGILAERLPDQELDKYDQRLMTAVVERAEKCGKEVTPLIVPTNNPLYAVINTAKSLGVQELIVGMSNKNTADEQLDQIALYWFNVCAGLPLPLTVRIVSRDREVHLDLAGGNRIPKLSERQARSVAELRAAGVGVRRVLLAHDGTADSRDLFQIVLTMLDPDVTLDLAVLPNEGVEPSELRGTLEADEHRAKQLGRELGVWVLANPPGPDLVRLGRAGRYDLIIAELPDVGSRAIDSTEQGWLGFVLQHAHCPVFLTAQPGIPTEVDATLEPTAANPAGR